MSTPIFHTEADRYWNKELVAIPVEPGTKKPSIPKWTSYIKNLPSEARKKTWKLEYGTHGVGVLTGSTLDTGDLLIGVDVDDDRLVRAIAGLLGSTPCGKRGAKGVTYFARSPADHPVKSTVLQGKNGIGNVDILSSGRFTVLPPTPHPTTRVPYSWIGVELPDFTHSTLPILDEKQLLILRKLTESEHIAALVGGKATHDPGLALTGSLVSVGATDQQIHDSIVGLLPEDYSGNSLQEIQGWIDSARAKGFDTPEVTRLPIDEAVARAVEQDLKPLVFVEADGFLRYRDGIWHSVPDTRIDQITKTHLLEGGVRGQVSHHLNPARRCLMLNTLREGFGEKKGLICCRNGTLDVLTGDLVPHSPDHELRFQLNVDYDPNAKCPTYDEHVRQVLGGDEKAVVLFDEFAAVTLVPEMRFQKALYLVGEGGSGKSTLLRSVEMMHDPEAVSVTPIDKLDEERHKTDVARKLVCISFDVQTNKRIFGETFMRVTGGDLVTTRRLYQEVEGRVKPTVRFMGSFNPDMPKFIATPDALKRRLLLVPCGARVANPDPERFDKIQAEKAGILARYARALQRLTERGRFDIPLAVQREVDEYVSFTDAFDIYASERLCESKAGTPVAEIAQDFANWADDHGEQRLPTERVGRKLRRLGYRAGQERQVRGGRSINTRVVYVEIVRSIQVDNDGPY